MQVTEGVDARDDQDHLLRHPEFLSAFHLHRTEDKYCINMVVASYDGG
jgi:hypothetical protein